MFITYSRVITDYIMLQKKTFVRLYLSAPNGRKQLFQQGLLLYIKNPAKTLHNLFNWDLTKGIHIFILLEKNTTVVLC